MEQSILSDILPYFSSLIRKITESHTFQYAAGGGK
jgi:hypothetical protein